MYLDDRSVKLLNILLQEIGYISVDMLATELKVSKRSIYNDVDGISRFLIAKGFGPLSQVRGFGYKLTDEQKELIQNYLEDYTSYQIFDFEDRIHLIYCVILGFDSKVDIELLQNLTGVSRNTLFAHLKLIRSRFERYNLKLEYTPKTGYVVEGSLIQQRSLFLYHYIPLIRNRQNKESIEKFFVLNNLEMTSRLSRLKTIEEELGTEFIEGILYNLSIIMSIQKLNQACEEDVIEQVDDILLAKEYELINHHFPELSQFNKLYYTIHLLGSMKQIRRYNPKIGHFTDLAVEMVEQFQRIAAIEFTQVSWLINSLANHLSTSLYRYRFGLHQSNPLLDQIKTEYFDVFRISNQVCDIIRNRLKVPVSDDEVAYITLHFNSFIRRNNYQNRGKDVVVVCPQGLSTSAMLRKEIELINPMLSVSESMSVKQFQQKEPDLHAKYIVSTVELPTEKTYLKVNAIVNENDRQRLRTYLLDDAIDSVPISVDRIMDIVRPYISERDVSTLYHELLSYIGGITKRKENNGVSMLDIFDCTSISIYEKANDWKDGIKKSCLTLETNGYITQTYADAIINATDKFGPYMVLDHGFMLAHANYSDGVNHMGLSFTKFEIPFYIDNKMVNKVFTLSPIDQKQHLNIMAELLNVFTDNDVSQFIDETNNPKQIHTIITRTLE